MNGPIRRLAVGIYVAMGALLVAVTWFQVVRADELKNDPRNARPALTERGKERGLIVTSDGVVVARSVEEEGSRDFVRVYPEGDVYAHVVGYSSHLVGESALERAYTTDLRSRRDLTISDMISAILGRDLRPRNLEITIDSRLQQAAFDALGNHTGAIIAIDPRTGAVLASVSKPSFEPTLLLGAETVANWEDLVTDPGRPLIDRATQEIFAPGSTFKTVVSAAALDTGIAEPGTTFDDPVEFALPGSTATISNATGEPCNDGVTTTMLQGFVRSCNTVFAALTIRVGAEDIGITAEALGWNRDLDYPWDIPRAVWLTDELSRDDAALAQSGIGERDTRATPLHMAMIAAAVANGGVSVTPYLVDRVFDVDGETLETHEIAELGRAMSSATAATLTEMMERVVTEGTGRGAAVPGIRVAGKTGTATGQAGFSNPWFIGFAPVDSPTIAIAVLIEGNAASGDASGGSLAAPIASRVIESWLVGR
ncbi:MAG: penicillin-binding protein 2 [Actinobacteria bacterium]|nr:penicillin-binding protein 2 [Actinomycetota bacterium]